MRVVITGGAGFVGSSLCRLFRESDPAGQVVAFDNLRRRGSELNLPAFKRLGIDFVHGDVRKASDLEDLPGAFDLLIEASAEPSVHAGTRGAGLKYLVETNLTGTLNCLDFARQRVGATVFLSTSRVYSIPALRALPLTEAPTRLELAAPGADARGLSAQGIAEEFPTVGAGFRSLYGSTKLASELFIEEYVHNFGLRAVINRCGVIAGAGQFGKTDQGVFTLWVARHLFGGALRYTGFGGQGKQVRDLLHPSDLFTLIGRQVAAADGLRGETFAVGGGAGGSVSLFEYTSLCEAVVGRSIDIGRHEETAAVDIPYFVSDHRRASARFGWKPQRSPRDIVEEIAGWLRGDEATLKPLFT